MTTVKRGHAAIASSLRPGEVTLVDELTTEVNRVRVLHCWPGARIQRSGVIRGAIRYVLEHREDFINWLDTEYRMKGRRDAE